MHTWSFSDGTNTFSAISNIYLTPGMASASPSTIKLDRIDNRNVEVVTRLMLRCGKSMQNFSNSFYAAIAPGINTKKIKFSVLHGRYDGAVTFTLPLARTLEMFCAGGLLHSDSNLFKEYLVDTDSSIRFRLKNGGDALATTPISLQENIDIKNRLKVLEEWVNSFRKFLSQNQLHIRHSRALHELLILLSNLSKSSHDNGLCSILLDATEALKKNIDALMILYTDAEDVNDKREYLAMIDSGIDAFRDYVGNYLISLAQAERLFIEGLKILHQSIASATKLILSYNEIIRVLAEITCRDKARLSYSFVVVSGGCDTTNAHNLFDYLDDGLPEKAQEDRLLVIQLSEMSLFNIQGTLFRIFHEAWHYCGDRQRIKRNSAWADSLAHSFSSTIATATFSMPPALKKLIHDCNDLNSKQLASDLDHLFNEERELFCADICKTLIRYFKAPTINGSKKPFYSSNEIYRWYFWEQAAMELEAWLHPDLDGRNCAGAGLNKILNLLCLHHAALLKKALEKVNATKNLDTEESLSLLNTYALQTHISCFNSVRENFDEAERIKRFVNLCLAVLCGYSVNKDAFLESTDRADIDTLVELLTTYDMDFHCELMEEAYTEAFSDYMACYTLNATAVDYIFGMIYETWDIDISLTTKRLPVLRIGSVLEACYGITTRGLSSAFKEELRSKYKQLCASSPRYGKRISFDDLAGRINGILQSYDEFRTMQVSQPLVQYLQSCGETLNQHIERDQTKMDKLLRIRITYERAADIMAVGDEGHDKIIGGVNALLQYWFDLNK